jgi:hypothetical protein
MKFRAVIAAALMAVLLCACGGSAPTPAGNPALVVPADALGYVELDLGELESPPATLRRLPGYGALLSSLDARFGAITGEAGPLARASLAHSTGNAALALLPTGGTRAQLLIVVTVARRSLAEGFLRRSDAPAARLLGSYLVVGEPAAVRAAAAVWAGSQSSLASSSQYIATSAGGPTVALLHAYAPALGVQALFAGHRGWFGELAALLLQPGLGAADTAVTVEDGEIDAWLRRVGVGESSSIAAQSATPLGALPSGVLLALSAGDLPQAAPGLISVATRLGFRTDLAGVLRRLGPALAPERAAVAQVLAMFSHGAAVAVTDDGGLLLVGQVSQSVAARLALADVEGPLSQLLPGATQVSTRTISGVPMSSIQLGSTETLAYAVFRHLVAITTTPAALIAMIQRRAPLLGSTAYKTAFATAGSGRGPILFADLSRLLALAVQTGSLKGPSFLGPLTPDFARIRLLGFRSGVGPNTTAELHLTIP